MLLSAENSKHTVLNSRGLGEAFPLTYHFIDVTWNRENKIKTEKT